MELEFMKDLRDNPAAYPNSAGFKGLIKPITASEIDHLEELYNNGSKFPKALRELLLLAGKSCYVLDYGLYDTQQDLQESVRTYMSEESRVIDRPFFAIDIYNHSDQFLFVYLDEGVNPAVYEGFYEDRDDLPSWITLVSKSLSSYIETLIDRVKMGRNPF